MSLSTPEKVQKLQKALHKKAKESPDFRFYALYDKVYRHDVLEFAYRLCRSRGGSPGVDGEKFRDIESYGVNHWLGELAEEIRTRTYRPMAVKRVYIPKPNGKQRPLGIPAVRDRVVQTAAVLVLDPIFEADMQPEQYAYRVGKSAHDAIRHVHSLLNTGYNEVVDADLSGYFDTIPHAELMKSVARRICDGKMLHLIKMWLEQPVEEEDRRGRIRRTTRNKDTRRGTPQGAPISPLLSNLYMRRFLLGWKILGYEKRFGARIVNYADDFVICCRGMADKAMAAMQDMMSRLKLAVNETKTHICSIPDESFDFLGYTIGRCWSPKTGKSYIGTRPSARSVKHIFQGISSITSPRWLLKAPEQTVSRLNRLLVGWSNYFCLGSVSNAYRAVDKHTVDRLRQWLRRKHKLRAGVYSRYPDEYLYGKLKLVSLRRRTSSFPWAKL